MSIQSHQDAPQFIPGQSSVTSEEEILAAVRKILTEESRVDAETGLLHSVVPEAGARSLFGKVMTRLRG